MVSAIKPAALLTWHSFILT